MYVGLVQPPEFVCPGIDPAKTVVDPDIQLAARHSFNGMPVDDSCGFECGGRIFGSIIRGVLKQLIDILCGHQKGKKVPGEKYQH
jgi:hypothetical protein